VSNFLRENPIDRVSYDMMGRENKNMLVVDSATQRKKTNQPESNCCPASP
jgi:hypothetical protein